MKYVNLKILIVLILILQFFSLSAQENDGKIEFKAGEKLEFIIFYGLINGGVATMELKEVVYNGNPAFHCYTQAKSTGITDKIYRVKDIYESFFNPDDYLPYKSIRNINEGKYRRYDEAWYFHDKNVVKSKNKGIIDSVPDNIRDMVSTFFYLRTLNFDTLEVGDIIDINTFFDNEVFPFDMRFRGREKVKTKLGTFNCIKLVPFVEPGRIFKTEDDMTIWLSPDLKYAPVRIRFDLLIGSLKIDLIDHSGIY